MYIDNDYLYIEPKDNAKTDKKISVRNFCGLLGLDNFKKEGDYLLLSWGLIKDEVDEKWQKRGDFAEAIVFKVYQRDGHKPIRYNKKEIHYDNFLGEHKWLSGMIDIELPDERSLVEVKSKNLEKYDFICRRIPQFELYQGITYGYLRNYDIIYMEYIFFDDETEQEIFAGKKPTTLQYLKRYPKKVYVNRQEMESKIEYVENLLNKYKETMKISLDLISDKTLNSLGFKRPIKPKIVIDDSWFPMKEE